MGIPVFIAGFHKSTLITIKQNNNRTKAHCHKGEGREIRFARNSILCRNIIDRELK